MGDNSIEELPQRVFLMLGKLEYLDLSNNPLQNLIPDVFKDIMVSEYTLDFIFFAYLVIDNENWLTDLSMLSCHFYV